MVDAPPIRKFMFDQTFDHLTVGTRGQDRNKPVTLKPDQLDQIKREAHDQGFAAGKKAALEEQLERQNVILARVEEQMTKLIQSKTAQRASDESQLRDVIVTAARKLLPGLMAREGLAEIQSMLSQTLSEMLHEPRLVVRVHESQFEAINSKLSDIASQKAYSGKVVVLADAEVGPGQCRVEWADGGIERDPEAMLKTIETIIKPETMTKPEANEPTTTPKE